MRLMAPRASTLAAAGRHAGRVREPAARARRARRGARLGHRPAARAKETVLPPFDADGAGGVLADLVHVAVRYLHILFGILWMGAIVMMNVVFFPKMEKMEPMARRAFMLTFGKAISRYGEASGTLTIVFGLILYTHLFGAGALVDGSAHAAVYLAALTLALVVLLLGALVLFPRMKKAMAILEGMTQPGPPPPELGRLMKPLPVVGMTAMVLVLVILGLMIVGATGAYR
jgi:uncharacterized membrane protein